MCSEFGMLITDVEQERVNYFHFSLLNGLIKQTYPMNGSVTDLNIWDRKLTQSEIRKWTQCNSNDFGRTVSREDVKLGNKS